MGKPLSHVQRKTTRVLNEDLIYFPVSVVADVVDMKGKRSSLAAYKVHV